MSDGLVAVIVLRDASPWGQKNILYRKHQNHDVHVERSFDGGQ